MKKMVCDLSFPSDYQDVALHIIDCLNLNGFEAYFVGGCVRDALLGKAGKDIDIVTNAQPEEVESIFEKTIPVGKQFGVMIVQVGMLGIEVATFRREADYRDGRHPEVIEFADICADASRRDFTINALYYDPRQRLLIDFYDGIADLKQGYLRTIGEARKRFEEDYLRMLRAVRFAARLSMIVSPEITEACSCLAERITSVSGERIFSELTSILTGPNPDLGFNMLNDWGLLPHILPEICALKGCEQPPQYHPEGDVWNHTILALRNMNQPDAILAWSVLLHDVGKPDTFSLSETGVPRFYNHACRGAEIAKTILQRLKTSRDFNEGVCSLVKHHMDFFNVPQMKLSTFRRFINLPHFELMLELTRLDSLASMGDDSLYHQCIERWQKVREEQLDRLPSPLVNGNDLIEMGFKPGKDLGKILKKAYDYQLEKEVVEKEKVMTFVKKLLKNVHFLQEK